MAENTSARPRIGIHTVSIHLINYGTMFQHTALRIALRRQGYAPFLINSRSPLREWVLFFYYFVLRTKVYLRHALHPRQYPGERVSTLCRFLGMLFKFRHFHLRQNGPLFEPQRPVHAVVVGSDQVLTSLEFIVRKVLPLPVPKIVYAGSADWKVAEGEPWQALAKTVFPSFLAVSVREQAGVAICQKALEERIPVEVVADPVLLLTPEEWGKLASPKPVFRKPTMVCYLLNIFEAEHMLLQDLEMLAERLGVQLKIVAVQGADAFVPARYLWLPSPDDFLAAWRDAEYVITNSFHGSCFALLFRKRFLTLTQHEQPGFRQNTRQKELLERVGLPERRIAFDALGASAEVLQRMPDWEAVHRKIASQREMSTEWLEKYLYDSVSSSVNLLQSKLTSASDIAAQPQEASTEWLNHHLRDSVDAPVSDAEEASE